MVRAADNSTRGTQATVAMKGGGYYSERTRGAKHVIDNAAGMLTEAVAALPEPRPRERLGIADFGAADGGTSKQTIYQTVAALRARFPSPPITVTYTDLPGNDYSTLFRNITGLSGFTEHNYLDDFDNVFVNACGMGFHRQLLPDASLDLGFSATAMHYISEKPCQIENHVHMVGASGPAFKAFSERAAEDWNHILLARSAELKPGGRLVFMNFGIDEQGRYLGNTGGVNMFDTFNALWTAMGKEGLLSDKEVIAATFAQYYRTREVFCAPLLDDTSSVYRSGLRLVSAHTGVVPCPYRAAFEQADGAMNAREFAVSYIPTLRSWSETVFANALDPDRPRTERDQLIDLFYQRYQDQVAEDPTGHAMDYVHCYLAIEKVV